VTRRAPPATSEEPPGHRKSAARFFGARSLRPGAWRAGAARPGAAAPRGAARAAAAAAPPGTPAFVAAEEDERAVVFTRASAHTLARATPRRVQQCPPARRAERTMKLAATQPCHTQRASVRKQARQCCTCTCTRTRARLRPSLPCAPRAPRQAACRRCATQPGRRRRTRCRSRWGPQRQRRPQQARSTSRHCPHCDTMRACACACGVSAFVPIEKEAF
jgi:hypothetical protein